MKRISRNLFERDGWYYFRWKSKGESRRISLKTNDLKEARAQAKTLRHQLVLSAFDQEDTVFRFDTVKKVLSYYLEAGCPTRSGGKRPHRQLKEEIRRIQHLTEHLGDRDPQKLTASDWQEYIKARTPIFKRGEGSRVLDMEWVAFNNAFRVAAKHPRDTGITEAPRFPRPDRQRRAEDVIHCRDHQPENAEELHKIAEYFLMRHSQEVYGWMTLLSAMVGQRRSEMLRLRSDSTSINVPGYDDGSNLWLYRSRTHKGTAATCEIGEELRSCIDAHRVWLDAAAPNSPWFFPSPIKPEQPVKADSFTQALGRACRNLNLPTRTAHGLRSYFVNVLRSRGVSDPEIALRIGHKSGGKLIVETYGEKLPIKLDWLPETNPAWKRFDPVRPKIVSAEFG